MHKPVYKRCKIVILPSDELIKARQIVKSTTTGEIYISHHDIPEPNPWYTVQHLYILSDEKIENNDWYLAYDNTLCLRRSSLPLEGTRKIIASTDPKLELPKPSNQFLHKYCDLGGIDEVLVCYNMEEIPCPDGIEGCEVLHTELTLGVIDGIVTLKRAKKDWNLDEVLRLTESAFAEGIKAGEDILALPTPRVRYNEWRAKNI